MILQIETSTISCSVALSVEGKTIHELIRNEGSFQHAEKLHPLIQELLASQNVTAKDLEAIAISFGPGSYTGLRIGVSTAKGLAYALQIPLITLDTLQILSKSIEVENGLIVPMIDARRMEVYTATFWPNGNRLEPTRALILDENAFNHINGIIHVVGDAVEKTKTVLRHERFVFHENAKYPLASNMSVLAFEKYKNKAFADVAYCEPQYVKEFYSTAKPSF